MMKNTGLSRSTRRAMGTMALALGAAVLPAAAVAAHSGDDHASGSAHSRTVIRGFDDDRTTVTLGRRVGDRVVVLPRARRTILVQAREAGSSHFVTQSRSQSTSDGRFRAVYAPTHAGTWRYRIKVLADAHGRSATSDTRVIKAVDLTAPGAVSDLQAEMTTTTAKLSWKNPSDQDFTGVTIRRAAGTTAPQSQVDGTAVGSANRNQATITDTGLEQGQWYSYALFARDGSGNYSRPATVTVQTGRFGVTQLEAEQVVRTSATLTWVNPRDDAFAGVIVRRTEGPTPPASENDGALVADVTSPEDSLTDTALSPGTTYSYTVFAHDAAQHLAAGVTTTITTRGNGVSSVLSVNPLPSVHTGDRVTVDTPVAFDASESLPTVGADLVAWEINYGDHISEGYNGPVSPVDVLNTTHTFTETGPHTVTLTVTDSKGDSDSTTLTVDVFDAPEVSVSTSDSSPQAGTVPFDLTAVTPSGTAITSYRMEVTGDDSFFVDGDTTPPTSQEVRFLPGSYTVVLTVTDDAGGTAVSEPVEVVVA